ncbi:MAG TPA: protein-L-isoaspartate(D-aspartate) O-methyltransferase [Candidatus Polarisedimenticolaceae bacterium]|nr:protein-L-isoaspartate(D-aspartate) O-methyltransferase [Candidatus Polarisedimenticolaceae bacterium]
MTLVHWTGLLALAVVGCATGPRGGSSGGSDDPGRRAREAMVAEQIEARGVRDPCVLEAMRRVPRELFVPPALRDLAYRDGPLAIGHEQTISQPYIVALMTELVAPRPGMKVLEVGTGSGYQAAVLSECVTDVYTIEIIGALGSESAARLQELGYSRVHTRVGDGYDGWPEAAPYDAIVVTAAPDEVPRPLLEQLRPGGRLVIPVGRGSQDLVVVTRTPQGYERRAVTPVRFVPMTGKAQDEHP